MLLLYKNYLIIYLQLKIYKGIFLLFFFQLKILILKSKGVRMYKPIIGITIGDPSGIGPEIVLKALLSKNIYESCRPVVFGTRQLLERAATAIDQKDVTICEIDDPRHATYSSGVVNVVSCGRYDLTNLCYGQEQALAGQIAMDAIHQSIAFGIDKKIDAVTTAPINKVAIKMVGVQQEGHTEIYRDETQSPYVLTMFDCRGMRVFHLSRHMALRRAIDYATREHIYNDINRIDRELSNIGITHPKIAVAGINPHCGEGGLFGDEEINEIIPAIKQAQFNHINATGPISPDTLFARGLDGEFDAILAMYHDQGHIPCKTIDLEGSVSVTLGLPFIRASVDHGTAFDIAGKGIVTNRSMLTAINVTIKYAKAEYEANTL